MTDKTQKFYAKLTSQDIGEILSAKINGTLEALYEKGSIFSGVTRFNRSLSHDEMSELIQAVIDSHTQDGEIGQYIITIGEWTSIIDGEYFFTVEEAQKRADELIPKLQGRIKNHWLTIRDRITGKPISTKYIAKFYTNSKYYTDHRWVS